MGDAAPQQERRNFYRINQDMIFDYKQVDVHTVEEKDPEEAFDGGSAMYFIGELRRIDREAQKILKSLPAKQRPAADYLAKLNSKIDLVARHSMFSTHQGHHATRVNISEGGIAFKGSRALYVGNFLVLRMIFLPSYTPVIVFAKVIRCEGDDDGYRVAALFHNMQDQDRQELARQIIKAQTSSRKRSSFTENNQ